MIATIIIWGYLFLLFYTYGFAVINGLLHLLRFELKDSISVPVETLVGLAAVSVIVSVLNLFLPLGAVSAITLLGGGVVLFILVRPPIRKFFIEKSLLWLLLLSLIVITVLELATQFPSVSDTALYHAQTIRWFESFPITPGLGNLHHRLAFNSSWLVMNAAFSFAFLGIRSFHLLGAFLFLICMVYFGEAVPEIMRSNLTVSGVMKLSCIPLGFHLFSSVISSPAYDMPVSLLIFVIVILWVENLEKGFGFNERAIMILLLSVYAITIKLSAIPIAVFAAWIVLGQRRRDSARRLVILISLAMLFIIPWVIRSVILSGYLVFPVSQIDLFPFDWKVSAEQAEAARNGIVGFARLPGNNWASSLTMPYAEWIPLWFATNTLNQQIILTLALLSPLFLLLNNSAFRASLIPAYRYGFYVLYTGMLFWFFSAPEIRFGYGFLAGACLYSMAPWLTGIAGRFDPALRKVKYGVLLGLLVFQVYTYVLSLDGSTFLARFVLPADYSRSRAESCNIKNGTVYCRVEGGQCNYIAFPCIPSPRPNVEMRGASFRDGFRAGP